MCLFDKVFFFVLTSLLVLNLKQSEQTTMTMTQWKTNKRRIKPRLKQKPNESLYLFLFVSFPTSCLDRKMRENTFRNYQNHHFKEWHSLEKCHCGICEDVFNCLSTIFWILKCLTHISNIFIDMPLYDLGVVFMLERTKCVRNPTLSHLSLTLSENAKNVYGENSTTIDENKNSKQLHLLLWLYCELVCIILCSVFGYRNSLGHFVFFYFELKPYKNIWWRSFH